MTDKDKKLLIKKIAELKEWQPIATPALDKLLTFIDSQKQKDLDTTLDSDALLIEHLNGVEKGKMIMKQQMMEEAYRVLLMLHVV